MRTSAVMSFWLVLSLLTTVPVFAEPQAAKDNPLREAYFGDLHLHTSYSIDAYLSGTTSVDPEEAYRFAKGEVVNYLGQDVRRREPLDFLAVTDHAENLGVLPALDDPDSAHYRSRMAQASRALRTDRLRDRALYYSFLGDYFVGSNNKLPDELKPLATAAWAREIQFANRHYVPGKFTTFIAYEWTAFQNGGNLHRNVIFKGDAAPFPFSSLDSKAPEDLWNWLETIRKQGFEALAIPHNGNGSNGLMYDWIDSFILPIAKNYVQLRQTNEPLSEISQTKGSSETHPLLSPNDEFADYEIVDSWEGIRRRAGRLQGSYVRDALSRGLVLQREIGANPYKFGFVGGSDYHNGFSESAQADFAGGKSRNVDAGRLTRDQARELLGGARSRRLTAGNLTGVWAERNTRDSIYDALRRKETFATTGSRLRFRFFGGWHFDDTILEKEDWVAAAYAGGVPMGGDLPAKPASSAAPTFVVWASKDPNGGNLDRVQVVKVWEENGKQQEKVFDVAWSGNRRRDSQSGKVLAVGNTVDLQTGRYANDIGSTEIRAVWRDPQFNDRQLAAYYLRVLEIPTPRWSTLLALEKKLPLAEDVSAIIQQRGWSSPIWYTF